MSRVVYPKWKKNEPSSFFGSVRNELSALNQTERKTAPLGPSARLRQLLKTATTRREAE